jgi:hypothetical protein
MLRQTTFLEVSQIVISNSALKMGIRTRPYAFTEQGVAMLSSVLRSPRAVEVNIAIMRTFVQLRRLILIHYATGSNPLILRLPRNHIPHPAARLRRVSREPGDHMDMRVPHGLSAGLAAVRADVEPVGRVARNEQFLQLEREKKAVGIFSLGEIEDGDHMPPRHDQRMPGRHREAIGESKRVGALGEDLPVRRAENADGLGHAVDGLVD